MTGIARRAAKRGRNGAVRKRGGPRPAEDRLAAVERMLHEFQRPAYIVRTIAARFRVDPRTVRADVVRLEAEIAATSSPDPELQVRLTGAALEGLRRATRKGDERGAARWLAETAKLTGSYAVTQVHLLSDRAAAMQGLSDDELSQILRTELVTVPLEELAAALVARVDALDPTAAKAISTIAAAVMGVPTLSVAPAREGPPTLAVVPLDVRPG